MNDADQWDIDSECLERFYRTIIYFEDQWKWIKQTRFRFIQWRIRRQFTEFPPIIHNRTAWGENARK